MTFNYEGLKKYDVIDGKLQNRKDANCKFFQTSGFIQLNNPFPNQYLIDGDLLVMDMKMEK